MNENLSIGRLLLLLSAWSLVSGCGMHSKGYFSAPYTVSSPASSSVGTSAGRWKASQVSVPGFSLFTVDLKNIEGTRHTTWTGFIPTNVDSVKSKLRTNPGHYFVRISLYAQGKGVSVHPCQAVLSIDGALFPATKIDSHRTRSGPTTRTPKKGVGNETNSIDLRRGHDLG